MTNLDQINGNGGEAQFIFDVDQTPKPSTVALFAIGLALLIMQRKCARNTRPESLN